MQHLSHFKLPESTEFKSFGCDAVLLVRLLVTHQRQSFEMSGPNHPVTQYHFPRVLNPQDTAVWTSNLTFPECILAVQKKSVIDMSYVPSESHLYKALWTLIRTEHFLGLLLPILHSLNLFFSWHWSTYTAAVDLGLNSNNAICLTSVPS
jgi:hypothetical protein